MIWFKTDALIRTNPKIRKLLRTNPLAFTLWHLTGTEIGLIGSDAVITVDMVEDITHDLGGVDEWRPLVDVLVELGHWHTKASARKCEHCAELAGSVVKDGWLMHDYWDFNPMVNAVNIPIERLRWMRKDALKKDRVLCLAIQKRDGDRCCYCDVQVNWRDRVGKQGATYDHLDPNLFEPNMGNTMENVVVACRGCNGQKKDRTPEEWLTDGGRLLLRDPRGSDETWSVLGRDQVGTKNGPGQNPVPTRSRERGARETERTGSEPGPDLVATRSSGNGSSNGHGHGGQQGAGT